MEYPTSGLNETKASRMKTSSDPADIGDEDPHKAVVLLRAVLETAPGLIYAKDLAGRMLIANPPTLDLIGKPWTEVRGRTDAELLDDRAQGEAIMANDRRVMAGGVTEVLEELVGNAETGTRAWLSAKAPLLDDDGQVIGLVGVSQDITLRKQAEQRLVELNETLEERVAERTRERDRAWNNSQDMLAVLDADGLLLAINSAWTTVLGYGVEELIGHNCVEFILADDHSSTRGALVAAEAGPVTNYENRYRHKDGGFRWISWVAASEGNRIYASGRHITAEKTAAAELAAKAAQLEASNRELESFTYTVSHDLRAPLRAIDGFGMMLEEDHGARLDDEGRRLLSVMRDNSRRMGVLIDDLLGFSRLSFASIKAADVNVEMLVRELIDDLSRSAGAPSVEFDVGPLVPAFGDRGLLRQAWINLLSNAVKYSSTVAHPRVQIRSRIAAGEAIYSIRDNGVGFDMQYADKLFGVFQRLHAADQFAGTGVGLAIVHRIVTRHGGRVWADGELMRGAEFSFALPTPL
jgi:PAS domain S-box-containing protein